jgi:hypothetical protein
MLVGVFGKARQGKPGGFSPVFPKYFEQLTVDSDQFIRLSQWIMDRKIAQAIIASDRSAGVRSTYMPDLRSTECCFECTMAKFQSAPSGSQQPSA